MCHEHEHHRHEHRRGPGRRFGRGGFPTREEWVERLEAHRDRLERDLANVRDLIDRLQDAPQHG
jgi:ribosomal protein L19E